MAVIISNWCHALCNYVMLFHMFGTVHSKVATYTLLSETAARNNAADKAPHIPKEFFMCGRDQSCTHVIELSSGCVLVHGIVELEKRKYGALRMYEKVKSQGMSGLWVCLYVQNFPTFQHMA